MKCECGGRMQVFDSRERPEGVVRYRKCNSCGKTIKTIETPVEGFTNMQVRMEASRQKVENEIRDLARRIFDDI